MCQFFSSGVFSLYVLNSKLRSVLTRKLSNFYYTIRNGLSNKKSIFLFLEHYYSTNARFIIILYLGWALIERL